MYTIKSRPYVCHYLAMCRKKWSPTTKLIPNIWTKPIHFSSLDVQHMLLNLALCRAKVTVSFYNKNLFSDLQTKCTCK